MVNYEDRATTMEAPDDEDRSLKCARGSPQRGDAFCFMSLMRASPSRAGASLNHDVPGF